MGRKAFVREQINDAAFDLFARRGYEAVSTREIAAQAKVGHASMYRHFKSKEDLGREVYTLALKPILENFAKLKDKKEKEKSTPRELLAECISLMFGLYDTRPRALALLIFPPHDFTPEELDEENPRNPRRILQEALSCDADTLAVIWGAITGPLQDRYLRRRTGKMTPEAKKLTSVIQRLID